MPNVPNCAEEVFKVLRSFDLETVLYDEDGNAVFDPETARRFFIKSNNMMVALVDSEENSSLRLYLGKNTDIHSINELRSTLRAIASKFNILFHIRSYGKVISPKDFATPVSVTEAQRSTMQITEGLYGTSRSSYLKLENARMIVRHKTKINENALGARGRNIEAILIENEDGERIRFPTTNLSPARALTTHVSNGGSWADIIGQQIIDMAKDFADLGAASRHIYVFSNDLNEEASAVRSRIREERIGLRRVFEAICRKTRYKDVCEALERYAATPPATQDLAEAVAELQTLISPETHPIDLRIVETVARVLNEDRRFKLEREDKPQNSVMILGREVSRPVWDRFKSEKKIDLLSAPDLERTPSFNSRRAQIAYYLGALASVVRDNSMSNLLASISERLPEERDRKTARDMEIVGTLALRFSGVDMPRDLITTGAVREHMDWINGFSANVLMEEDYWNGARHDEGERILGEIGSNFNYDDFKSYYGFDLEEEISKERILSALTSYLDLVAEEDHNVADLDTSFLAASLYPKVRDLLKADGFMVLDEGCCEDVEEGADDDELSIEDVLLPTDEEGDLFDEVTTDKEHDPDYLSRMKTMAGVAPTPYGFPAPVIRNFT